MKVVIAIDSFKGSLSSLAAGNAVGEGIRQVYPEAELNVFSLADGGEGTVEALSRTADGELVSVTVKGPLGENVEAQYCIMSSGTAVIEMASAAGITLVPKEKRNPLNTTTYGVGEIIKDAIIKGCRNFIIGIGGSATNDGGTGMLTALGYKFLDSDMNEISLCGKGLEKLAYISDEDVIPELKECKFRIACDVTNPLCGENGCSAVFGPQKGADKETVEKMDKWLENYAIISKTVSDKANENYPGTGAAGGLGFAFRTFTDATLESGIKIILDEIKVEEYIKNSDIVITGEGRLDSQTVMGKTPAGVADLAKKYSKTVIAFSGCVDEDAVICNDCGIDAYFPIIQGVTTLEDALNEDNAYSNLSKTTTQVFRLIKTMKSQEIL